MWDANKVAIARLGQVPTETQQRQVTRRIIGADNLYYSNGEFSPTVPIAPLPTAGDV